MNDATEKQGGTPVPFKLMLHSVPATRRTFARIIREYAKGRIAESDYKAVIWGLSQYLGAFRLEKDIELEKRLEALEDRINA